MRPAWGSLTQVGSIVREVVEKYKTPLTNFLRSFCGFRKELSYASAANYSPVWRARGHMWPAPSPFARLLAAGSGGGGASRRRARQADAMRTMCNGYVGVSSFMALGSPSALGGFSASGFGKPRQLKPTSAEAVSADVVASRSLARAGAVDISLLHHVETLKDS